MFPELKSNEEFVFVVMVTIQWLVFLLQASLSYFLYNPSALEIMSSSSFCFHYKLKIENIKSEMMYTCYIPKEILVQNNEAIILGDFLI